MKPFTLKEVPIILLGVIWIVFIFLDYWNKHPFYSLSFDHFKLTNFTLLLLGFGGGMAALYHFIKGKKLSFLFSGLSLFLLSIVISIAITYSFTAFAEGSVNKTNAGQSVFGHALTYTGNALVNFFELILIFFSVFSIGYQALRFVNFDIRESSRTIYSTVIGIMILTFVLFILAMLGLLYNYIFCLLYTSPSPRDQRGSRMPSSA